MCEKLLKVIEDNKNNNASADETLSNLKEEIERINSKEDYYHYFDIRTNHLNEKDWRRSFGINQFLYGIILFSAKNGDFETFEEIMNHLKEDYGKENS